MAPSPPSSGLRSRPLKGRVVILVEDEPAMLRILARGLSDLGAVVESAANAREALALLETTECDAVLTDYSLPPHEDGVWVLEHAARLRPRALRLLMSANEHAQVASLVQTGVVDRFFLKPPDPDGLVEVLAHGPQARGAHG